MQYLILLISYNLLLTLAKFETERLRTFVHELLPQEERLAKKRYHFVLAEEESSYLLTGFGHNAICPLGMLVKLPVIICSRCVNVSPSFIFLGGGEVDLKLGISIPDLIRSTGAMIANISEART